MPYKTLIRAGMIAVALAASGFSAVVLTASGSARADDGSDRHVDPRVKRGFEIAPVPLNLSGKDPTLVGIGSYIVNGIAACDDCHTASVELEFSPGGTPFFGQPTVINPSVYLGGGRDFGPVVPGSPDIVSRNLTPDRTGKPIGGRSFAEFREIMRTGIDLDHLHPSCSASVTTGCLPAPFDGNLLQIMPWPFFQNMTDYDLRAIYEYLSAIPCIEGPPAPSVLHNDCT